MTHDQASALDRRANEIEMAVRQQQRLGHEPDPVWIEDEEQFRRAATRLRELDAVVTAARDAANAIERGGHLHADDPEARELVTALAALDAKGADRG